MWEILAAVFGGMYWACKVGSDRSSSNKFDKSLAIKKSLRDEWEKTVVDDSLERRIELAMMVPEAAVKLRNDALNVIRSFYGMQHADFAPYYEPKHRDYYIRKMIVYIELVKHGKLPSLKYDKVPNYLELALDIRPSKRSRIEFGKWLEKTMRDNGVQNATVYYTGQSYASFCWGPFVCDISNVVPLDDPDIESKMKGASTDETDMENAIIIQSKLKR